jgi:pyruvate/2-oxoglutarate dehydrogenase complex dihydrolipoamide acyltransferase (E2) component
MNNTATQEKDGKPLWKLSVDDFVIKALAPALQRVPDANANWTESGMPKHRLSDVGVAVAIKGGRITPVVRNAETKPLSVIANEMKDLARRARSRQLKPEEYRGGVGTVCNLGRHGIKEFTAAINPTQATILAVGAGASLRVSGSMPMLPASPSSAAHRLSSRSLAREALPRMWVNAAAKPVRAAISRMISGRSMASSPASTAR